MKTVKLVKFNKQTQQPEVRLMVSPSVSKFDNTIVFSIATVSNGQIVRIGTFTQNQLREFCYKVLDLISMVSIAENLFGTEYIAQKINEFYSRNQVQQPQPVQPVVQQQPTQPVVQHQPVQPNQPVPQQNQSQPVNQPSQPIQQQNPSQPVIPQQYKQNLPDIDTI